MRLSGRPSLEVPLRRRLLSLSALLCMSGLASVAPLRPVLAQEAPWPTIGGGPAHTASADGPEPPYRLSWEARIESPIAAPVLADGLVVVVAGKSVVALDPSDGSEVWTVSRAGGRAGAAAVLAGLVVYAAGDDEEAEVVAVSQDDGSEIWTFSTESVVGAGLGADESRVYAGTRDGTVHAIDAEDGSEVWSFEVDGRIEGAPAVAEGTVLITALRPSQREGTVHALDAETGEEAWTFAPAEPALGFSAVSSEGGLAFVGSGDRNVRALELDDGRERWSAAVRSSFSPRGMPAVPGDVVMADVLGDIYRLDAGDGAIAWDFRVPGSLLSGSPVVAGDAVVVGDDSGQASAVDLESGLLVWKTTFGEARLEAPAADGDRIYLVSRGGSVVALEHDPDGVLLSEPSPTTLFPIRALLNFLAAGALVLAFLLLVFRVLLRDRRPSQVAQ